MKRRGLRPREQDHHQVCLRIEPPRKAHRRHGLAAEIVGVVTGLAVEAYGVREPRVKGASGSPAR